VKDFLRLAHHLARDGRLIIDALLGDALLQHEGTG
jgi:hypothetical protein